jgi:FtsP/CotA-like multicopper oxidase with cupredoxin domain
VAWRPASSKPGRYSLTDSASAAGASLRGVAEDANVIAVVVVEGQPLDMALPTSEQMAALAPFPNVDLAKTADGVQTAVFQIGSAYDRNDKRNYFQINSHPFNPNHTRTLQLGATEMWSLSTIGDPPGVPNCGDDKGCGPIPPLPHVFHIHVNPFQVTRQDPQGKNEVVWKDTVLVPPGPTINIFTRYLDYIGKFVMHCHILDHEDLGMMELVEVVGEAPLPGHGGH